MIELIETYKTVFFIALVVSWLFSASHRIGEIPIVYTITGLCIFFCSLTALIILVSAPLFS